MMMEVHTVSIVPKKMYDGNICSCQAPVARGKTNCIETTAKVSMPPAAIFASRFALNGSSRDARIMAMGISIKDRGPQQSPPWEMWGWILRANNKEQGKHVRIQVVQ